MSQGKIWFLNSGGQVSGPYDEAEIETRLNSAVNPQIWGRGSTDWLSPNQWKELLGAKSGFGKEQKNKELWVLKVEDGPLEKITYDELISKLKAINEFANLALAPESESLVLKNIFSYPPIIQELNISRRVYMRVPITGTLVCQTDEGEITCRATSISEGGLGIYGANSLKIGQSFKGTLLTENLYVSITSLFEVVYTGSDGYTGVAFVGLPSEYQSSIIEYVKKFTMP